MYNPEWIPISVMLERAEAEHGDRHIAIERINEEVISGCIAIRALQSWRKVTISEDYKDTTIRERNVDIDASTWKDARAGLSERHRTGGGGQRRRIGPVQPAHVAPVSKGGWRRAATRQRPRRRSSRKSTALVRRCSLPPATAATNDGRLTRSTWVKAMLELHVRSIDAAKRAA